MSENLKTIKELADELGISKKYLQNKISYEKKKQDRSIFTGRSDCSRTWQRGVCGRVWKCGV